MGQALHFNMNTMNGPNTIIKAAAEKWGKNLKLHEVDKDELGVDVMPFGMKSGTPSVWLWGNYKGEPLGMEFTCENFLGLCGIRIAVAKLAQQATKVNYLDGADLIADERTHQRIKGYDWMHDAKHADGSMLSLAQEIILNVDHLVAGQQMFFGDSDDAPWEIAAASHIGQKHKGNRIHILAIAGAMIAAEIDRLIKRDGLTPHKSGE